MLWAVPIPSASQALFETNTWVEAQLLASQQEPRRPRLLLLFCRVGLRSGSATGSVPFSTSAAAVLSSHFLQKGGLLSDAAQLAARGYERSDRIGMMHRNRSDYLRTRRSQAAVN